MQAEARDTADILHAWDYRPYQKTVPGSRHPTTTGAILCVQPILKGSELRFVFQKTDIRGFLGIC